MSAPRANVGEGEREQKGEPTTFFTLPTIFACVPLRPLQSSPLYGAHTTTASSTTISLPSHLAGIVRLSASKISCASLGTFLFLFFASCCSLATAFWARVSRAAVGRGVSACGGVVGVEVVGGRRVKEWMLLMGRMWVVVAGGAGERARRLVRGQAVKMVPSRVVGGVRVVLRRIL